MRLRRRHSDAVVGRTIASSSESPGIDFAWHVHTAQESWANKADVKASIVLALEGGALFAVISAHATDGMLTHLQGWHRVMEHVGLGLLLLALVFAVAAVYPRIRVRDDRGTLSHHQVIYFGHVRNWDAKLLATQLQRLTPEQEIEAISRQLVAISRSNWSKLRSIQISLAISIVSIGLIAAAAVGSL